MVRIVCAIMLLGATATSVVAEEADETTEWTWTAAESNAHRTLKKHGQDQGLTPRATLNGDFDKDGVLDVMMHFEGTKDRYGQRPSLLAIALGKEDAAETANIIAQIPNGILCSDCVIEEQDGATTTPRLELGLRGNLVKLCESWGEGTKIDICSGVQIVHDHLRVSTYSEVETWNHTHSTHALTLDLERRRGTRSLLRYPQVPTEPVLEDVAEFSIVEATPKTERIVVDGVVSESEWEHARTEEYTATGWVTRGKPNGNADIAFTLRTTWDDEYLFLGLRVDDDFVAKAPGCEKDTMEADSVEIWLDAWAREEGTGNTPYTEHYRRMYGHSPTRNAVDEGVYLATVTLSDDGVCTDRLSTEASLDRVLALSPTAPGRSVLAMSTTESDGLGYSIEVAIPWADVVEDGFRPTEFGFSLAVTDVDQDGPLAAAQVATSSLRWGDPFTFGTLLIVNKPLEHPTFPFVWADWISQ